MWKPLLTAAVLTVTLAPAAQAGPPPAPPGASITLVTGDRVLLSGDNVTAYLPGQGREHLTVHRYTTPLNVTREAESYDVSLTHLDAAGQPASRYSTRLVSAETGRGYFADGPVRLPKGRYMLVSAITTGEQLAVLAYPALEVGRDIALTLDARTAKPVSVRPAEAGARERLGYLGFRRGAYAEAFLFLGGFGGQVSIGHLGPADPEFEATIAAQFEGADRDPLTKVAYRLSYSHSGKAPTGFDHTATPDELTEVTSTYRPGPPGREYLIGAAPLTPRGGGGISWLTPVPEGGRIVDLVTADGPKWAWTYYQRNPETGSVDLRATSSPRRVTSRAR